MGKSYAVGGVSEVKVDRTVAQFPIFRSDISKRALKMLAVREILRPKK
jgi:hypothetical protein